MEDMNVMSGSESAEPSVWGEPAQNGGYDQSAVLREARKHFSRLGITFLIGAIITYALQFIVGHLVGNFKPEWLFDADMNIVLSSVLMYGISMPVLIALIRVIPPVPPVKHKMKASSFIIAVIICFGVMYASNLIGRVITMIIGFLKGSNVNNTTVALVDSTNIWVLFVCTVICAPIIEEYVFRKLLIDRVLRYGQGAAVLLSGLMFGLFHGNLNQFAYTFPLGLLLAFLYVKTGKLKVTIAIHMIINFAGGVGVSLLLESVEKALPAGGSGVDAMAEQLLQNAYLIFVMLLFVICVIGAMIAGNVLLIVALAKKRFALEPGQVIIPKGKRFRTVILNVGMLLFIFYWVVKIIWQLFA